MEQKRNAEIDPNADENLVWHKHKVYHFCETSLGTEGRTCINLGVPCEYREKLLKVGLNRLQGKASKWGE